MKTRLLTLAIFIIFINTAMYSNVVIINGLTHVYSGASGQVIKGEVVLINNSTKEQKVSFELNDAIFSCSENRIFTKDKTHQQSSNTWFNANLMEKVLASKEQYVYRFTINIPEDSTLKGSFWSVLMVNVEKPIKKESRGNIGLDTKVRYAVGLLTNVNSYDDLDIDFKNIILKDDEVKKLEVKIVNNSLFIEGTKLSLEVYDTKGDKVLEFKTRRNMVFPGFCKDYLIDVSKLPKGDYKCVLLADSREEFIGTNVDLTIK